ncbi:MAG: hypothetical protein ACM34A_10890 [Bacillota bacterium]
MQAFGRARHALELGYGDKQAQVGEIEKHDEEAFLKKAFYAVELSQVARLPISKNRKPLPACWNDHIGIKENDAMVSNRKSRPDFAYFVAGKKIAQG